MTYIISICSAKGGTGKTCTTINLGMALKELGKDVTILDANLTAPNLGLNLGFSKIPITLNDVLRDRNHITEAVYIHSSGLKLIPASIAIKDLAYIYSDKLKEAYHDLKKNSEIIIVDNAPGLSRDVVNSIKYSDEILIVTNPDLASVTDALRTMKLAQNLKIPIRGVVLTRVTNKNELSREEIEEILGSKIISIVPEDDSIKSSIQEKNSVINLFPKSKSSLAYKKLASDILGKKFTEKFEDDENRLHKFLRFFGFRK